MLETLALCTCVLGFFMAFPLMAIGRIRPANFWLGLFVFSLSCVCVAEVAASNGWYRRYPHWAGIFDWPLAAIAPSFYCYVRTLTDPSHWQRRLLHFLPVLWFSAWLFLPRVFIADLGEGEQQLLHVRRVISSAIPLLVGLNLIYAAAVLFRLRQFRLQLRQAYSSTRGRDLQWLTGLSAVIVALLIVWVLALALGGMWDWTLVLGRVTLFYFVGWYGMRQTAVFRPPLEASCACGTEASPQAAIVEMTQEIAARKYRRSGMTESAKTLIGMRLSKRMHANKDFLEDDLKLLDLAARIGTSAHLLSQYLNEEVGCNFFNYINGLRVAEVQNLMREAANVRRSLMDLSQQAGFSSKSHFNASFRRVTGMTPSVWRRAHADQLHIKS